MARALMARGARRRAGLLIRAGRGRGTRIALGVIGSLLLLAAAADCLAADLPLVLSFHRHLYVAPNLRRPAALRPYDNRHLRELMGEGDWAIFPPVPWGYNSHDLSAVLAAPSGEHLLGTDSSGRDVCARLLHGARISLLVGFGSTLLLSALGLLVGGVAAYAGGYVDLALMRVLELVHALPSSLLLVTLLAIWSPHGWRAVFALIAVIGLTRWTTLARLVRAEILRVRGAPYVEAARALGYAPLRVVTRHILPNALTPLLIGASFAMASAILLEGALSFLGFGIPRDMASWGGMLNDVRDHTQAWWLALFPGAAIFISVSAYNLVGEGLRDAIDSRLPM
jgi:peptide/nickel transport system permease protein